jgi:DNA-binding XRE family transcriptional regulator
MSNLAVIRKCRGLPQWKLAELLDVHWTTVSQWETGRQFPSKRHLDEIARVLRCTLADLLSDQ